MITRTALSDPGRANALLEQFCRAYWYPVYAYVRRSGRTPHDSEDLTQGFFEHLLEGDALRQVDKTRGRFRSFILASLSHFLVSKWRRDTARKRGGEIAFVPVEEGIAESLYERELITIQSPDRLFDRRWALLTVEAALERLRSEHAENGRSNLYDILQPHLLQSRAEAIHEAAAQLHLSDGAVKVALHRMRRRFGHLLRSQVARTVASVEDVEEEIRHLLAALAN